MPKPTKYTLRGCTIVVASGGRSASGKRVAIYIDGKLVQSAAQATFGVICDDNGDAVVDAPTPQVQAHYWAQSLPKIIGSEPTPEAPAVPPAAHAAADHDSPQQPTQDAITAEVKDDVASGQ